MLANALTLDWAFGFSKDKIDGTVSLCMKDRNALFLISSHSGVIYDFEHRTQTILQGHCNIISCCVVDKNKRWIVTADTGVDPIMVIWDAYSFVPVKTYALPHEGGVESIDISDDALYIATLGCPTSGQSLEQELAIWAWSLPESEPVLRQSIGTDDYQYSVKFDLTDNSQLATTGEKSILFWRWDDFNLASYSGRVSKTDLGHFGGDFVTTLFLPSTENALTATTEGYVIVWESNLDEEKQKLKGHSMKEATKVLKLVDCGINIMTTTRNDYLAVACTDGAVRFYDYFLRLEAWFEDLNAGPITSLSFSVQDCPFPYGEAGAPGLKFWVPDFVVGTSDGFVVGAESSIFDEVRREDRRGTLLMQGMSEEVVSVSCHPTQALLVIACANGVLQIWNYDMKLLMILREFNSGMPSHSNKGEDNRRLAQTKARSYLRPQCTDFDASGKVLAVGFTSGLIKLLFTENLEDGNSYAPSSEPIQCVKFSSSGKFLAAYDTSRHILLFKKEEPVSGNGNGQSFQASFLFGRAASKPSSSPNRAGMAPALHDASFVYIGRARAHSAPVTGICFGFKDGNETLISISEDQYCVEYDLTTSSLATGVVCVKSITPGSATVCSHRIEPAARPTAIMWHPKLNGDFEDRFVTANDVFKFKEFNLDSKQCRRTSLAPRFGNPVTALLPIPPDPTIAGAGVEALEVSAPAAPQSEYDPAPPQKQQLEGFGNEVDPSLLPDGQEQDQQPQASVTPGAAVSEYFVFATNTRVIGLSSFPLTGDPSETMGIVAHPGDVTCVAVSHDGKYVFSGGGYDLSVNMWRVDVEEHRCARRAAQVRADAVTATKVEAAEDAAGEEGGGLSAGAEGGAVSLAKAAQEAVVLRPYFSLLEGGEGGELHRDIVDYFYYCQLRHLGEDSMETRNLTGEIPLDEIPSLFRSVGYYPSEDEVLNIINEVRYKNFVNTGETQEFVGLSELIRLYINHRPALPLDQHLISAAFDSITDCAMDLPKPAGQLGTLGAAHNQQHHGHQNGHHSQQHQNHGKPYSQGGLLHQHNQQHQQLTWGTLRACLLEEGECISEQDLDAYLAALTGGDSSSIPSSQVVDPKFFAEQLLGFEDFSDNSAL